MATGIGEAVEGYIQLAQWAVREWGARATAIAQRLDAGTYTADTVMADLTKSAALAVESLVLLVNEPFDAAQALLGEHDRPHIVTSHQPFTTEGGVAADRKRRLRVDGPLVALLGSDTLPASAVRFDRNPLPPGVTQFRLVVDATGHDGVTYTGAVSVLELTGPTPVQTIAVWISVP